MTQRCGIGFDVHKLVTNKKLYLDIIHNYDNLQYEQFEYIFGLEYTFNADYTFNFETCFKKVEEIINSEKEKASK